MMDISLFAAVTIFIAGLGIRVFRFAQDKKKLNLISGNSPGWSVKSAVLNTLFQARLFHAGKIRWAVHFLLVSGFLYLLIVHGLHGVFAHLLFSDYQPTLDPFQLLRNLSGLLVLAGCAAFLIRRHLNLRVNRDQIIKRKGIVTIILILMLVGSGFLLEASKILSEPIFMEMVEDYGDIDEHELMDLKLYWQDNYSVFFQKIPESSTERLEAGKMLNEDNCLYCHSAVKSAVLSHALAKTLYSAGQYLNSNRVDRIMYGIHYVLCLIMLACLPFSRLFHIVLIPFASFRQNLSVKDYQDRGVSVSVSSLYACTNCGYCSQVCSVYPNFQVLGNPDILPHAKIQAAKALIKDSTAVDIRRLNAGNNACTLCHKCTDVCPSNIDLQSLWQVLDKKLDRMGEMGAPHFIDEMPLSEWAGKEYVSRTKKSDIRPVFGGLTTHLASQTHAFENCIQCTVCTNVCPVVEYDEGRIDMTPHQIMNLLRLGKKHLATGTRMVWSCLTCYACQENCPQQIRVTDILLELRDTGGVKADMIQKTSAMTRQADK